MIVLQNSLIVPVLLINGNLNQQTFANALLAAHFDSQRKSGKGLGAVLVVHSRKSHAVLSNCTEWRTVVCDAGLNPAVFEHVEVDLEHDPGVIVELASHVERFIGVLTPENNIYVDLTNGQSLQKAALGAVAYVLGAKNQFIIDPYRLGKTPASAGFLEMDDLARAMVMVSDPMTFDSIALAWFTEVRRFRELAGHATLAVGRILGQNDPVSIRLWQSEMLQAVRSWLAGQKQHQATQLGASVRHSGLAFEELVRRLHARLAPGTGRSKHRRKRLEDLINDIGTRVPADLEDELVNCLAHPLRKMRNKSTHGLTQIGLASRRARIGIEILLALVEYLDACFGSTVLGESNDKHVPRCDTISGTPGTRYFFGLDGDNTGDELERLFCQNFDEATMKAFSEKIDRTVKRIADMVKLPPFCGEVIFCAGDDLLFSAAFDRASLESLRREYAVGTDLTCSIGFGLTMREAYCALKIAKSRPGKSELLGIRVT